VTAADFFHLLEGERAGHVIFGQFSFEVCDNNVPILVHRRVVSNDDNLCEDQHPPERESICEVIDESGIVLQ
jgi:hypothetical protein